MGIDQLLADGRQARTGSIKCCSLNGTLPVFLRGIIEYLANGPFPCDACTMDGPSKTGGCSIFATTFLYG